MRKRISLQMCVYSTGDTQTISRQEQESLEHFHRLKKIAEIEKRKASKVHTTAVVYNPNRHKYAIVYGEKIKITCKDDFEIYVRCNHKIVDK